MSETKRKYPGRVVRISDECYKRLKEMVKANKCTYSDMVDKLLSIEELLSDKKPMYCVNNMVTNDLSEARGYAIQIAAKEKKPVKWPLIVIPLGTDSL